MAEEKSAPKKEKAPKKEAAAPAAAGAETKAPAPEKPAKEKAPKKEAADKATAMITENREKLDALAKRLEEIETLDEEEIEKLIGPSVNQSSGAGAEVASYRWKGTAP